MLSQRERARRLKVADTVIKEENLDAMVIVGNAAVGTRPYGCFRYFVDNRILYDYQAFIAIPDQAPTICCGSVVHIKPLRALGYQNIRIGEKILTNVIKTLKEHRIEPGRIGVSFEMLPAIWYQKLRQTFPDIEWVDVTERIFFYRGIRSEEEITITRECAAIADAGYQAILNIARPGITEEDVAAELDCAMKKNGAEETFTLISSGKFSFTNNKFSCLRFATSPSRVIETGDSIAAEITPRYKGYWTQMVRTINVGEANPELARVHEISRGVIQDTVKLLVPGQKVSDIINHIETYIKDAGFIPALPYGHICSIDLNEGRVDSQSDVTLTEGTAVILHPTITTQDISTSIFWGETYLVTAEGGENLMKSSQELITV